MYKNNHINMLCTCSIDNFKYISSIRAASNAKSSVLSHLLITHTAAMDIDHRSHHHRLKDPEKGSVQLKEPGKR